MTRTKPPSRYEGTPNRSPLPRGTTLWRVHRQEHRSWSFNPRPSDPLFGGARFDATEDEPYPFYYAALDERTAVAETLLRDLEPDETGCRAVTWAARESRRLSALVLTRELDLVSLVTGEDLGAIGQDAWLVTSHDYPQTRAWAHWIRDQDKQAHGLIWRSLRDPDKRAIILFGDRCAETFGPGYEQILLHEVPEIAVDLDTVPGEQRLRELLEPYRVTVSGAGIPSPGATQAF